MNSNFELLKNKEIIEILDGDKIIEEIDCIDKIKMPYLSGPQLCALSQKFGCHQEYYWANSKKPNLSRWMYLDNLIDYLIKEGRMNEFLHYMFSKERFVSELKSLKSPTENDERYNYIISSVINKINSILYFSNYELNIINNNYIVNKIGEKIEIKLPTLKAIDSNYIKNLTERANKDIIENNYDSAITKARTILEETFCYVIELKKEEPSDSGDIHKLYKQVKSLYNMHTDKDMDTRINKLLSGLENIVQSLSEMRNNGSDSHGLGSKRINVDSYHARLCVNSASIMAEFILSIANK